jgi:Domain of unknown function (DUF4157)
VQRDPKRRSEQKNQQPDERVQRRVESTDTLARDTARVAVNRARDANYELFVQRFATTPEARLAASILGNSQSLSALQRHSNSLETTSTDHQKAARGLPITQRVRLQRLLQSQHVAASLSLGQSQIDPVQRLSSQSAASITGLPVPRVTQPQLSLQARLQRHRDSKTRDNQPFQTSTPESTNLTATLATSASTLQRSELEVTPGASGENLLGSVSPLLSARIQRSSNHVTAVREHVGATRAASAQRQRAVQARGAEVKRDLVAQQLQRLRAPDAPSLDSSGKSHTMTGLADQINTDLPMMRAKHNHDPSFLEGDTPPVTDFVRHVGLSLGRQYQVQRAKDGTRPGELAAAISRVHDASDRSSLMTGALSTFHPNDRETAQIQRLVSDREEVLHRQGQQLETTLEPVAQRQAEREAAQPENLAAMIARAGGGEELPEVVRRQLQPQFNFDLRRVRIHRDGYADQLAKTVNAIAFTTGTQVFFRSGQFDPTSPQGRGLLVHELTHVGQQLEGRAKPGVDADQGLEDEAVREGQSAERQSTTVTAKVISPSASRSNVGANENNAVQRSADTPNTANPLSITGTIPVGKISGVTAAFEYKISAKLPSKNGIADSGIGYTEGGTKLNTAKTPPASKVKGNLARVKDSLFAELKTSGLRVISDKVLVLDGKKMFLETKFLELNTTGGVKENETSLNLVSVAGKIEDSKELSPYILTVEISAKLPVNALLSLGNEASHIDDLADYLARKMEKLTSKQLDLLDKAENIAKELHRIESEIEKTRSASRISQLTSKTSKVWRRSATRFAGESSSKIAALVRKTKLLEKSRDLVLKKFLENQARMSTLKMGLEDLIKTQKPLARQLFVRAVETKFGAVMLRLAPKALLTLGKFLSGIGWVLLIADFLQAANGLLLWLAGHRKFKFLGGDGSVGYFDFITESFQPQKKFKDGDPDEPSDSSNDEKSTSEQKDGKNNQSSSSKQEDSKTDGGNGESSTKNPSSSNTDSSQTSSKPQPQQNLETKTQIKLLSFMTSTSGGSKLSREQYAQILSLIGSYDLDEKTCDEVIRQLTSGTLADADKAIGTLQQILAKLGVPKAKMDVETATDSNTMSTDAPNRKRSRVSKDRSTKSIGGGTAAKTPRERSSSRLVPYSGPDSDEMINVRVTVSSYSTNKQGKLALGPCKLVFYSAEYKASLSIRARITEIQPTYVKVKTNITSPMAWRKGKQGIAVIRPSRYAEMILKRQ